MDNITITLNKIISEEAHSLSIDRLNLFRNAVPYYDNYYCTTILPTDPNISIVRFFPKYELRNHLILFQILIVVQYNVSYHPYSLRYTAIIQSAKKAHELILKKFDEEKISPALDKFKPIFEEEKLMDFLIRHSIS